MLLFRLRNERKTCGRLQAVLELISMIPPDTWQYLQLADRATAPTRRHSTYSVTAVCSLVEVQPIKRPSVCRPLFPRVRRWEEEGFWCSHCIEGGKITLKNFKGIATVMVTDQHVSRHARHWSKTLIVDCWSSGQTEEVDIYLRPSQPPCLSTVLRLLLEAAWPTPDNPTHISARSAWRDAAGNKWSASTATGCKLTMNHTLRAN